MTVEALRADRGARLSEFIPGEAVIEPALFDGHVGWLHHAPGLGALKGGLVLCSTLGREQRSAHRPLWILAQRLASEGFAVLRYDHLGSGESAGLQDGDAWPQWIAGVGKAAAWLRGRTGVEGVALAGLRLGASLVAQAAETVRPDALMLLAPVVKGGLWARELELNAKMNGRPARGDGQPLDADGLVLSAETLAALGRIDLGRLDHAAPHTFVASPAEPKSLMTRLQALGSRVTWERFQGCDELFLDAYANTLPTALFDEAAAWLDEVSRSWRPSGAVSPLAGAPALPLDGGAEVPVVFGDGLRGMLCLPDRPAGRRAVVFMNTGGDPRAGIGSFAVSASRRLVGAGVAALRFDFAGLGDSDYHRSWRSTVYDDSRVEDLRSALRLMADRGYDEIYLAGVCSGAFHALEAAMAGAAVKGIFAVNPGDWVWPEGSVLNVVTREDLVSNRILMGDLAKKLLKGDMRPLLHGDVTTDALKRRLLYAWRSGARNPQTKALRRSLKEYCERGGKLRVVVGHTDVALDEMEVRFGHRGRWISRQPGGSVRVLEHLDHGLAYDDSRAMATAELMDFVQG